jgi:hypothetical protein
MTEFLTYIKNGTISSSIIYNKGAVTNNNALRAAYKISRSRRGDGYSMFYFTVITNNSVKGLNILRWRDCN